MTADTKPNFKTQLKETAQKASQTLVTEGAGAEQWLKFSFNGLATPPVRAVRSILNLFSWLEVHPGTWAVCHTPAQEPSLLQPGVHWLTGMRGTTMMVQFVDTPGKEAKEGQAKHNPVGQPTLAGADYRPADLLTPHTPDERRAAAFNTQWAGFQPWAEAPLPVGLRRRRYLFTAAQTGVLAGVWR